MEDLKELKLIPLTEKENKDVKGGLWPAVYAAVVLTQHAVSIYGATKVASAVGTAAGAAGYAYVNS